MFGNIVIPVLILILLTLAAWKKLPVYDLFALGAREGMRTCVQILPNLAAMLCAITLMQESGLMDALCSLCGPAARLIGLPAEVAPLILLRPFSGSASLAMAEELMHKYGADSRTGLLACTLMGSSETIFYTVCVYMSTAENRETGYAIPCALGGMTAGIIAASLLY